MRKQVRYAMLALKSYEQANGFSVLTEDELFFINGGSGESISIDGIKNAVEQVLPPSITITDNGLTAPFGDGTVSISVDLSTISVTLGFEFKF